MLAPTRPSFKLVLPYPPTENHYKTYRVVVPKKKVDGKVRGFAMWYLTDEAKKFKEQVSVIARNSGVPLFKGDVLMVVNLYRPTKAGDLSNRFKVLFDALIGIVYDDDKQIARIEGERFEDKKNPRVEVTIQERI